jgi:hypothetical protein
MEKSMKKFLVAVVALVAVIALPALAGEWHSGATNLCADCHTMHFSMQHGFDGAAVSATATANGNWLSATGPNAFLLKAPANQLCLSCHDGQSFAPDVLGTNANASPTQGRAAGALNETGLGAPYDPYKGHTLGATTPPPGYSSSATFYDATAGLECISCHAQHGSATAYRNLGPYSIPGVNRPTYVISTTNDTTKDVWINIASYTANSGSAATFNTYYDSAAVSFNRNDATSAPFTGGTAVATSNKMDTFCGACHADFHGGAGDANIGATAAALDGFIRHPTSSVTIGGAAAQSYGGHSVLSQYVAGTTKVKVYASDRAAYTDAAPGCLTCHKAHGNQNPFGLVFLSRTSATVPNEEGGLKAGVTNTVNHGYQSLCGQCHTQASAM